jgi:UDP-2,3-diacylglucosamine pyrophosphatase LpxH
MSNKFNGFEKWFIDTALEQAIETAEQDVLKAQSEGKNVIFAPGYFRMVGNDLKKKVNSMTIKKDQDAE